MTTYKFRVLLDTINNEEIFRDIEISSNDTFETFYKTIIKAFYFNGDQMASFYCSNNDWDKGEEITLFDMNMDDSSEVNEMSTSIIKNFIEENDQKFILVYDFLKMWCFLIELIQIKEAITESPIITLSIGISPKEETREIDFSIPTNGDEVENELGDDFDDIFSEFEDEDDFGGFENIDDLDI